jgi:hypothetical protein
MKKSVIIDSLDKLDIALRVARSMFDDRGPQEIIIQDYEKPDRQRTTSQNASLHKYCDTMSGKLNDAGYTQRQLVCKFKEGFELPVTMEMIKAIFREVGLAMYEKESTKKLTTTEIKEVYKVVDQRFGEITGCRSEWPSVDSMADESRNLEANHA